MDAMVQFYFTALDEPLAAVLQSGAIRLLDASYLRAGRLARLARRQDLPESAFLSAAAAVEALRRAERRVCFTSHAWRTVVEPDPDGTTRALPESSSDRGSSPALATQLLWGDS